MANAITGPLQDYLDGLVPTRHPELLAMEEHARVHAAEAQPETDRYQDAGGGGAVSHHEGHPRATRLGRTRRGPGIGRVALVAAGVGVRRGHDRAANGCSSVTSPTVRSRMSSTPSRRSASTRIW